jgi:HD-like signal output (HDOD) protein
MKHILFVDDEPKVLQGIQRQLYGMRNEWKMSFAAGGAKALEFMETSPVDVIVTDMMMPCMDGAQLLTEVMRRHPNTVRIVLSGHVDRESVFRLVGPAHQYLSKPCEAEELRSAVTRAFALRDLLSNEQLKQLATRTKSLPALPALYTQLTKELEKEDPSVESIANIIVKDLGMTAKILQLVNSSFFGLPQQTNDPAEAVAYLGLATVRALVLSLQVFSQFDNKKILGFSIDTLAEHCWMTGAYARKIAQLEGADSKVQDQCFLAGLLHDVGQLVLAAGLPEQYGRVLERARVNNQSVWTSEMEEFGATHAEVGGYLLGLWGLPNGVVEAVALHHRPIDSVAHGFSPVVAVHIANSFAHDKTNTHPEWPGNRVDEECLEKFSLKVLLDDLRAKCFDDENL